MDKEKKDHYIENNKKISLLLAENEQLLKDEGYMPPDINFSVDKEDRINVPAGYIRKSGDFWSKYHLFDIVESRNIRNNISYALQLSDYYNYWVNRFNIWGSIEIDRKSVV